MKLKQLFCRHKILIPFKQQGYGYYLIAYHCLHCLKQMKLELNEEEKEK